MRTKDLPAGLKSTGVLQKKTHYLHLSTERLKQTMWFCLGPKQNEVARIRRSSEARAIPHCTWGCHFECFLQIISSVRTIDDGSNPALSLLSLIFYLQGGFFFKTQKRIQKMVLPHLHSEVRQSSSFPRGMCRRASLCQQGRAALPLSFCLALALIASWGRVGLPPLVLLCFPMRPPRVLCEEAAVAVLYHHGLTRQRRPWRAEKR